MSVLGGTIGMAGGNLGDSAVAAISTTNLVRVSHALVVRACGRTMHMPEGVATLQDVQTVLQMDLGMRDQLFEISDAQGMRLADDMSLTKAIAAGKTPLVANLSDSSIHFIENRREELAHMQWKLVRDQHHSATMKTTAMSRQIQNLEVALEHEKVERLNLVEKLKAEVAAAIEQSRQEARLDLHVVEEQVAGISNMVTSERNMREVAIERTGKEIQGVRDLVDARLNACGQSIAMNETHLADLGKILDAEKSLREAFEERHRAETEAMIARIDEMSNRLHRSLHEFERSQESVTNQLQDKILVSENNARFGIGNVEMLQTECNKRLAFVEERAKSLEGRLADFAERQSEVMERLALRNEKVSQIIESLRADNEIYANTWKNDWSKRILELEELFEVTKREMHEQILLDKRTRDQELAAFHEKLLTEHGSKLSQLDAKMFERLERESRAREDSIAEVIDNVVCAGLENAYMSARHGPGDVSPKPSPSRVLSPSGSRQIRANASAQGGNNGIPVNEPQQQPLTARGVIIHERAVGPPTVETMPIPTGHNISIRPAGPVKPVKQMQSPGGSMNLRPATGPVLPLRAVSPASQAVVRSVTPTSGSFRTYSANQLRQPGSV